VLHVPALPLHCALAWLAPMAVPSTIAASRERVALIVEFSEYLDGAGGGIRRQKTGRFCRWSGASIRRKRTSSATGFSPSFGRKERFF
jgi:hypothetical protein